ncbi:MAG: hypothetical protein PHP69_03240 [Candidatus Omnitrophica bacterium]|nr:hypothetical protein [Candidatus Omnitrophota bacterium]MDD5081238.1 hypothetical protein [Candidatus Omnitrophota bacterium]
MNSVNLFELAVMVIFLLTFLLIIKIAKITSALSSPKNIQNIPANKKTHQHVLTFMFIIVGIALVIFHITHSIDFVDISKKPAFPENVPEKISNNIKKPQKITNPEINIDFETTTAKQENTTETHNIKKYSAKNTALKYTQNNLLSFEDYFVPATVEFSQEDNDKRENNKNVVASNEISPVDILINGSEKGDIFICAAYDRLNNGIFEKTNKVEFFPQGEKNRQIISISIPSELLALSNTGKNIQLPLLFDGWAIEQYAPDMSFSIDKTALLTKNGDIKSKIITYNMYRAEPIRINYSRDPTDGLQEEFSDIPEYIRNLLNAVKNYPEHIRLATIAAILNSYFGYQTGIKNITYKKDTTWNEQLNDTITNGERLLCDCDVLSTYTYIYMKFLGFHPIMLVGYVNNDSENKTLKPEDMHTTLYLKYENNYILFDPTIFTKDYRTLFEEKNTFEKINRFYSKNIDKNKIQSEELPESFINQNSLNYFTLPEELLSKVPDKTDIEPNSQTARILVQLMIKKEQIKNLNKTKEKSKFRFDPYTICLLLFCTALIYRIFAFIMSKGNNNILTANYKLTLLIYSTIFIPISQLFIKKLALTHSLFWTGNKEIFELLSKSLFLGGAIIGTLALIFNKKMNLLSKKSILISLFIINISAFLNVPSFLTLFSLLMSAIFLYRVKN